MTTTQPTPSTPLPSTLSPLGGTRAARAALVAGGLLFAAGNLLHPLDHGDAAELSPTWAAAASRASARQ